MRPHSHHLSLPLVALVVTCALGAADAARAQCTAPITNDNSDNDCDGDGQSAGAGGDCLDCDIDRIHPDVPDCITPDPSPGTQTFPHPAQARTVAFGGAEICDFFDNTCDNVVDEGFDADGDSFSTCEGDCNDSNANIRPGAAEQCDGVDQDCDGTPDQSENITRSCYDGPGGTQGVGICTGGTQTCTGSSFGPCNGQVLP